MKKLNKNNKGFSLVELLVVIAIMVVLVGVIAPTLLKNIEKSRVAADVQTLDSVAGAIQAAIGSNEDAYTQAMALDDTFYSVSDLYAGSITGKTITDLTTTVSSYLAQSKIAFKGTKAKEATSTTDLLKANLQFKITDDGVITVQLLEKGKTTYISVDSTNYSITR